MGKLIHLFDPEKPPLPVSEASDQPAPVIDVTERLAHTATSSTITIPETTQRDNTSENLDRYSERKQLRIQLVGWQKEGMPPEESMFGQFKAKYEKIFNGPNGEALSQACSIIEMLVDNSHGKPEKIIPIFTKKLVAKTDRRKSEYILAIEGLGILERSFAYENRLGDSRGAAKLALEELSGIGNHASRVGEEHTSNFASDTRYGGAQDLMIDILNQSRYLLGTYIVYEGEKKTSDPEVVTRRIRQGLARKTLTGEYTSPYDINPEARRAHWEKLASSSI